MIQSDVLELAATDHLLSKAGIQRHFEWAKSLSAFHRGMGLLIITTWVGLVQFGLKALSLEGVNLLMFLVIPGLVSPLAAALCCLWAASVSEGGDRQAWRNFGVGSALYFIGNSCYLIYGLSGINAAFPTLPELCFFLMAVFFTVGMFQYGAAKHLVSRIQFYNFGLIFCAVTISGSLLLHPHIVSSKLTLLGTIFAFVYPVLWFSVAAFGLVCLLLYAHRGKRFPFTLLLLAIVAEASADAFYAKELMAGDYSPGGFTLGSWTLSVALIIWAAIEQSYLGREGTSLQTNVLTLKRRRLAEASVPAVAVTAVIVSASISTGVIGYGTLFLVLAAPATILFAALIGLREHWALLIERKLRTAARKSQFALSANQQQLSSVLESTTDSVLVLDRQWRIVFFNQRAAETIGSTTTIKLGAEIWDVFSAEVGENLGQRFEVAVASNSAVDFEQFLPDTNVWLEVHAFPSPKGLSVFFRDISEARLVREEITRLARHDPLTGLANRVLFREELQAGIASGGKIAALFLDLDHFKEVNDTLGHPVGDALLCQLADRLRTCVRNLDSVGRLGGDEFAIIQPDIASSTDASDLAQRILEKVSVPYTIDGQTVRIGASIGIAVAPANGANPDTIFKDADIALYTAKADGRGTYRFFEPAMEERLQEKQGLKTDLTVALAGSEFDLAFQPIIDLHSNKICCFEALLRWNHPTRGAIPPSVFVPVAEDTGLIVPIGNWVLQQACAEATRWPSDIRVAVNLSSVQFRVSNLPSVIESVLRETGLSPHRLELEITESVLLQDSEANLQTLHALRAKGVRIALDDFGTGYASLGYVQKFPFSKIKIDRSFVSHLPDRGESRAIVNAVTGLGRALGIPITAEGVETRQQLDRVRQDECDEAQGYFFSRPICAADIPALLEKLSSTEKFWGDSNARRRPAATYAKLPVGQI